jgi:hypothetical protein
MLTLSNRRYTNPCPSGETPNAAIENPFIPDNPGMDRVAPLGATSTQFLLTSIRQL